MKTYLLTGLCALLAFLCSSCDRDQPAPKHTVAWLSHTDGDQLTFRDAASGATRVLRTAIEDRSYSKAAKFDLRSHDYQIISLRYLALDGSSAELLRLQFNGDGQVAFGASEADGQNFERHAYITTHQQADKEQAHGSDYLDLDLDLLDNHTLNGRAYARVARLRYWSQDRRHTAEYWYSKAEGLVAYSEPTGRTWHRVW